MRPSKDAPDSDEHRLLDPVYAHARREAVEILVAWAAAMFWTVGYCAVYGYRIDADEIELVWGIPSWVLWGVAVPWLAASLFTLYYSLVRMKTDSLGEEDVPVAGSGRGED